MHFTAFLAHPYTVVLARWLLAGVLLVSGSGKLLDRQGFVQGVIAYQIMPASLGRAFALGLPYGEIALGLALLIGLWTRPSAILAIALLVTFLTAITVNLARGRKLDCHCFGTLHQEPIGLPSILRNSVLLLLAADVSVFADGYLALDRWLPGAHTGNVQAPPGAGLLLLVLVVAASFAACLLIQQLWIMTRSKAL